MKHYLLNTFDCPDGLNSIAYTRQKHKIAGRNLAWVGVLVPDSYRDWWQNIFTSDGFFKGLLYFIFLPGIILSSFQKSYSQSVTISSEIRPRFEVLNGYRIPPDTGKSPQILVSQRTRLNALYTSDRFNAYISLQDARIWGDEVLAADVASFGLHEAWGQYNLSKKVGLKAGRQEFIYDNKRLLTNGEWPQQSRGYDAAVLKLNPGSGWKIDLGGSYNQQLAYFQGNFYNLSNYKTLDFLWINKLKTDSAYKYSISAIGLGDGYQTPDTSGINMRYTYGINGNYLRDHWGINFEVYGQSGKTRRVNQSGNIVPDSFDVVNAYMFSVNPYFIFGKFQIGAAIDYLSGSDALDSTNAGKTQMFNPQYGANDRFYGKIDLFFNLPADTRNAGLIDAYLTMKYLWKKWNFGLDIHYFALQNQVEDIVNPGVALDKLLGTEADFSITRDITKEVSINTGIAVFVPTRSMEFVKATGFGQLGSPPITGEYVYLMVTFKPVFFSK